MHFVGMNTKFSHLIKFIITGYGLNPLNLFLCRMEYKDQANCIKF